MPQVRVAVETEASIALVINTDVIEFDQNLGGRTDVEMNEENLMVWSVAGDPGAKYKITLSVLGKREIKATTGENPVDTRISTRKFRGGGFMRFEVRPKENA